MSRSSIRRVVVAVFLSLVLASSLQAGEARRRESPFPKAGVSEAVVEPVSRAWAFLWRLWTKAGCGIDPHGACTPDPITTGTKAGCRIDPHGVCIPDSITIGSMEQDEGCGIDPHGRCGE